MAAQIVVVGIFESKGYAQDARNRLRTEGVPEANMALTVLREVAPVPETTRPELAALSIDPLILGDVEKSFARFIRNGETAVLVQVADEGEAQFASDIMSLYAPLAIELLVSVTEAEPLDDPGSAA
ncbi:MAG TPA: hypothetical protein VMB84_19830 [Stellaceae bacterium]|nr:hypothetical protein [Stellaceae bacterium]